MNSIGQNIFNLKWFIAKCGIEKQNRMPFDLSAIATAFPLARETSLSGDEPPRKTAIFIFASPNLKFQKFAKLLSTDSKYKNEFRQLRYQLNRSLVPSPSVR